MVHIFRNDRIYPAFDRAFDAIKDGTIKAGEIVWAWDPDALNKLGLSGCRGMMRAFTADIRGGQPTLIPVHKETT